MRREARPEVPGLHDRGFRGRHRCCPQGARLPKRKMILYGDSYGTFLGQSYAMRYGKGLRGLILSSAYPGDEPFWRTLYPAAKNAVRLSCKRFPECSGNALGRLKRTMKRAGVKSGFVSNILGYLMGDAAELFAERLPQPELGGLRLAPREPEGTPRAGRSGAARFRRRRLFLRRHVRSGHLQRLPDPVEPDGPDPRAPQRQFRKAIRNFRPVGPISPRSPGRPG